MAHGHTNQSKGVGACGLCARRPAARGRAGWQPCRSRIYTYHTRARVGSPTVYGVPKRACASAALLKRCVPIGRRLRASVASARAMFAKKSRSCVSLSAKAPSCQYRGLSSGPRRISGGKLGMCGQCAGRPAACSPHGQRWRGTRRACVRRRAAANPVLKGFCGASWQIWAVRGCVHGSMRIDAGRCESMRIDAGQAKPSGLPGMKVAPSCGRGLAGWWAEGLVAII